MKKLVCLGLVAAMVVSLVACGSSNTKSTESKASESAAASESSADQAEAASGLKIALVMSGAANDQGWNQTAYEGTQKASSSDMVMNLVIRHLKLQRHIRIQSLSVQKQTQPPITLHLM